MDNNQNVPGGSDPQQYPEAQPPQDPQGPQGGGVYQAPPTGQPKKSRAWIWIAAVAVVVVVCVVLAVVVFGGGGGSGDITGNAGVVSAYQFFAQQQEKQESMMGPVQKEIGKRLMEEPFEIASELEVASDSFADLGLPVSSITVDLDAKYDLKDLGVKVKAMGMEVLGAYVIEDDVVLDVMGQATSMPIDLPVETDLGKQMRLKSGYWRSCRFYPRTTICLWICSKRLPSPFRTSIPKQAPRRSTARWKATKCRWT